MLFWQRWNYKTYSNLVGWIQDPPLRAIIANHRLLAKIIAHWRDPCTKWHGYYHGWIRIFGNMGARLPMSMYAIHTLVIHACDQGIIPNLIGGTIQCNSFAKQGTMHGYID